MLSVKEATEKVLSSPVKYKTDNVYILDSLFNVLAEDIISQDDIPSCDNSAVDGFALKAADLLGAERSQSVKLRLFREDIPAGKITCSVIESGTCMKIMTGAPIPQGCDCVVMKEDVLKQGNDVLIFSEHKQGENIRFRGEDIKKGDTVIKKGKKIYPADIGVLASIGRSEVLINKQPVIGIITTGDELIEISNKLEMGKVRDSNSYFLAAQILETRTIFKKYGILKDNKDLLMEHILQALNECDILLLTGGVSVGDYDYVKEVLKNIGAEFIFSGVKQKPGKPVTFLTFKDKFIFGLPGNPVAAMVCFEIYVRPLIKKIMGDDRLFRKKILAKAADSYSHKDGRTEFIRVKLDCQENGFYFTTTGAQGSGVLTSMAEADGLAIFPEFSGNIAKWTEVEVLLIK